VKKDYHIRPTDPVTGRSGTRIHHRSVVTWQGWIKDEQKMSRASRSSITKQNAKKNLQAAWAPPSLDTTVEAYTAPPCRLQADIGYSLTNP